MKVSLIISPSEGRGHVTGFTEFPFFDKNSENSKVQILTQDWFHVVHE